MEKLITEIEKVVYGGKGLGTQDEKKVFIPDTFTGDQVHYEVMKDHKNFVEGRALEILEKSPHRIPSPCPYSQRCGGCQWIGIDYKAQVKAKASFIEEAFERIGKHKLTAPVSITPSSKQLGYRNRIQLRGSFKDGKVFVGFFEKESHTQIHVKECLISHEAHNKLISYLNELKLPKKRTQKFRLEVQVQPALFDKKSPCLLITLIPIERKHELEDIYTALKNYTDTLFVKYQNEAKKSPFFLFEESDKISYYGKPGIFQQINTETNALLRKRVKEIVEKIQAKSILDLYCGSGNLSLGLADDTRKIEGVELNPYSIEVARHNVQENSLESIRYKAQSVKQFLKKKPLEAKLDLLILDPPRRGAKEDLDFIEKLAPNSILYISCDPSTAARDYKILSSTYSLESLEGFDFFPQTYHIETLFLLKRKN